MDQFRASYTILNTWASGDYERTIKSYFRLEEFDNKAMADGRDWHNKWAAEVLTTNSIPKIFGDKKLKNPTVEQYMKVQLSDWLELSGKIDCLDEPTIYDWKTGKQSSEAYASDKQVGIYGVLCTMKKIYVDRGEIYHFDQYKKQPDMSVTWITDKLLKDSLNWIETLSSEIHNYFIQNDLYKKYNYMRATRSGEVSVETGTPAEGSVKVPAYSTPDHN